MADEQNAATGVSGDGPRFGKTGGTRPDNHHAEHSDAHDVSRSFGLDTLGPPHLTPSSFAAQ